jgi:hypothetical protein
MRTTMSFDEIQDWLVRHGISGWKGAPGAADLAQQYRADMRYATTDERVAGLIRWECGKSFATGFASGLAGVLTLPATVPAALASGWLIQARLVGTIAELYGYRADSDRVRTAVALLVFGGSVASPCGTAAGVAVERAAGAALKRIPGRVFIGVNRKLGFRFVTKAGTRGVVNAARLVPVMGAVVIGSAEVAKCFSVGRAARLLFS